MDLLRLKCPVCHSFDFQYHSPYTTTNHGGRVIYKCENCPAYFSETKNTRRCSKGVDPVLDCDTKLVVIDEEADHQIVHGRCFGKNWLQVFRRAEASRMGQ